MKQVAIQAGHLGMKKGETGAPGEQEFNAQVSQAVKTVLEAASVRVIYRLKGAPTMYSARLMEHFHNPRNVGTLENADACALVRYPPCGDWMQITVRMEGDRVAEACFKVQGCGGAIAAASVLTEILQNKNIRGIRSLAVQDIVDALDGLPEGKMHCARMAVDAARMIAAQLDGEKPELQDDRGRCESDYETTT